MEEVGEGLRDPKRIGTPQADKEATNINPWGLPKTEPPSQEQAWAGPITHTQGRGFRSEKIRGTLEARPLHGPFLPLTLNKKRDLLVPLLHHL